MIHSCPTKQYYYAAQNESNEETDPHSFDQHTQHQAQYYCNYEG